MANTLFETTLKKLSKSKTPVYETSDGFDNCDVFLNWLNRNVVKDSKLYKTLKESPLMFLFIVQLLGLPDVGSISLFKGKLNILLEQRVLEEPDLLVNLKYMCGRHIPEESLNEINTITELVDLMLNYLYALKDPCTFFITQNQHTDKKLTLHKVLFGRGEKQLTLKASSLLNKIKNVTNDE